jgi:hypothetical protein
VVAAAFGEVLARLEVIVVVQVAGGAAIAFVGLSLVAYFTAGSCRPAAAPWASR